jgi:hypothetical protein
MIIKYIQCDETLILTVTNSICDDETQSALTLAKQYDPDEIRTLRIYTQYDRLMSNHDQLRNVFEQVSHMEKLSSHMVVCRHQGTKQYCNKTEELCNMTLRAQSKVEV